MTPKEKEDFKKEIVKEVAKSYAAVKGGEAKEIIFREGKALDPTPKIKMVDVTLSGTIGAPVEFFKKRPKQFKEYRAHVMFSKNPDKLYVTLKTNENKERPHYSVTGTLALSEEMQLLGIVYKSSQSPKTYTVKELSQLLRFNKRLFAKTDECKSIVEGLMNFRAKVTTEYESLKEKGGSITENFHLKVSHGIPLKFSLSMPLFKGKSNKKFDVDICFEVKAANEISMWLESMELATFIQSDADAFINEELKELNTLVQIEI